MISFHSHRVGITDGRKLKSTKVECPPVA